MTNRLRAVAAVLALGVLLPGAPVLRGQAPPRQPVDVARLGPQVGERVPDFTLTDQNGKRWTLQTIMGAKGAMLVFFRSADW
jgi:cytochrome oxidase Cu insertion factor (SCO1/SenC/PrrC family)